MQTFCQCEIEYLDSYFKSIFCKPTKCTIQKLYRGTDFLFKNDYILIKNQAAQSLHV